MISRGPGPTSETSLFHIPVWNVVSVSLFAIILLSFFAVVNRHPLQIIRLFFIDCSEICFINRAGKIFSLLAAQRAFRLCSPAKECFAFSASSLSELVNSCVLQRCFLYGKKRGGRYAVRPFTKLSGSSVTVWAARLSFILRLRPGYPLPAA